MNCLYVIIVICISVGNSVNSILHEGPEGENSQEAKLLGDEIYILILGQSRRILDFHFRTIQTELAHANNTVQTLYGLFTKRNRKMNSLIKPHEEVIFHSMKKEFHYFVKQFNHLKTMFNKTISNIEYQHLHSVFSFLSKKNDKEKLEKMSGLMNADKKLMADIGSIDRTVQLTLDKFDDKESRMSHTSKYKQIERTNSKELRTFTLSDIKVNWTEAEENCTDRGMQLAMITNFAEETEVTQLMRHAGLGQAVWAGGNVGSNDCIVLVHYDTFDYKWDHVPCSQQHYFVCGPRSHSFSEHQQKSEYQVNTASAPH